MGLRSSDETPDWSTVNELNNENKRLRDELDAAKIEAVDLLEHLGEMAWGVDLPVMMHRLNLNVREGESVREPVVIPLDRELAKLIVEDLYQRMKKGRGWLKQERARVRELEAAIDEVLAYENQSGMAYGPDLTHLEAVRRRGGR